MNPRDSHARHAPGRFLQALAIARNRPNEALAFAQSQNWADLGVIVPAIKALATAYDTDDFPSALLPLADAFLAVMRPFSIPLRLPTLRRVPMYTRIFVSTGGVTAIEVSEGAAIPVMAGTWDTTTLRPRKFAGISVLTDELMHNPSAVASLAVTDELLAATAAAENRAFANPEVTGSALNGAPNFVSTGATVAAVDADLKTLVDLVPGAVRPGAAFVMAKETATFLSLLRGSGGSAAYPLITPQGGFLIGLPVLVSTAAVLVGSPTTRIVGLISPSEIFWADEGRVVLSTSKDTALQMIASPTNLSTGATAPTTLVTMFQTGAVAIKAVRESVWYARAGAGAYFVVGY